MQRKASLVLMGLLHWWQRVVGTVMMAVKRCPLEDLFSLSLASRSRSLFFSFSFSCKIQNKRWINKWECRCVKFSAFSTTASGREPELCIRLSITEGSRHRCEIKWERGTSIIKLIASADHCCIYQRRNLISSTINTFIHIHHSSPTAGMKHTSSCTCIYRYFI